MPSRLDRLSPLALSSRAGRRLAVLLVSIVTLAGAAAGMVTLVRPAPQPRFVGAWLLGSPSGWSLWETASHRDQQVLADSGLWPDCQLLASPAPTRQQVRDHLAQLQHSPAEQPVVLYLAARATLGESGSVELLLGGRHAAERIALTEVLHQLASCPARHKWLVLDLASAELAPWTASAAELSLQTHAELGEVDDPNRIVLCQIGRPLASETWHRSALGFYLEQGLRGAADGWLEGRTDGRVSAREASRYVACQVRLWSAALTGSEQAPELLGTGEDFDLVAFSLRNPRRPGVTLAETGDHFPAWLAQAWKQHAETWNRSAVALRPRLYRRGCHALLRAEQQLRGGRDSPAVERDLNDQLAQHRADLAQSQAEVAAPAGYSVFMFRKANFAKRIGDATSAFQSLSAGLQAQTEGLPAEEAAAASQQLQADFHKQTEKLPAEALAAGAIEHLSTAAAPTAEEVILLNRIVRTRQPQPVYTETLLLNRLALLAEQHPRQWSGRSVAPLLSVARQSSRCLTADPAWCWTRESFDAAAQAQHDAEYLLLRPGYAPPELLQSSLAAARQEFRKLESAQQSIRAAYAVLGRALRDLPAVRGQLAEADFDPHAWQAAVEDTARLAELMRLAEGQPGEQSSDLVAEVARLDWAALLVENHLDLLQRSLSEDRLVQLVLAAEQQESTAAQLQAIDSLLSCPTWSVAQRRQLVTARGRLSGRLHEQLADNAPHWTENLDRGQPLLSQAPASGHASLALQTDAEMALGLCRLAGFRGQAYDTVARQSEQLRQLSPDDPAHGESLRQVRGSITLLHERLSEQAALQADPWAQMRLGSVADCQQPLPRLDDPRESPSVALRRQIVQQRNAALADLFAYKALDDTPELHTQLARRYDVDPGGEPVVELRFAGDRSLPRPMRHRPEASARVSCLLPPRQQIDGFQALAPDDSLAIVAEPLENEASRAIELNVTQLGQSATAGDQRGVLLVVEALGRHWHCPLPFEQPTGPALRLLWAAPDDAANAPSDALTLRPSHLPQTRQLLAANHSERDFAGLIEIEGVGQAEAQVPAGQTVPLIFQAAAADPAQEPPAFSETISLRITEASAPHGTHTQSFPLRILSPTQYVRVVESRFLPGEGDDNLLRVALTANALPPGPPCLVQLELSPERIAGLQGVTGGSRHAVLPTDGTPVVLTAEGLLLGETVDQQARFSVTVDGVRQALTLEGIFPRRGDPTSPRQVLESQVELAAPRYALSGSPFQPLVKVAQAPAAARLRVRIGHWRGSQLIAEREQTAPRVAWHQVQLACQKDGSLACRVSQGDWPFQFDTTGMVGPRVVQAELLDAQDQVLAVTRTSVTFDDTAPERAAFRLPPQEALLGQPLPLDVMAADAVSGIAEVYLFIGRPNDNQVPAEAKRIEAVWNAAKSLWEAELPPAKEAGQIEVTAQAINHVGLSRFATVKVNMVSELAVPGGEIRGLVVEGPRGQSRLQVQLLDATGAALASTRTDAQGRFRFADVKPGAYLLSAEKPSSGRHAWREVTVEPGAAQAVTLELTL